MALKKIPVRNDLPAYTMRVDLNAQIFILGFRFNQRLGRWVLDISLEDGTEVLQGIILLTGVPLLTQYKDDRLPLGELIVLDRAGKNINATRETFGDEVELYYNEVE